MYRPLIALAAALAVVPTARAHFVFVVPDKDGRTAKVILSEDLEPDDRIPIATLAGTTLVRTDAFGHDAPLALAKSDHAYTVNVGGPGVIRGTADLGVVQLGKGKPWLLSYYPKAILGDPFAPAARLGGTAPMELVPTGGPGHVRFQLLLAGKPDASAAVHVLLPDGTEQDATTDVAGQTGEFAPVGRYGVWGRQIDATAGDRNGKHYDEVRRYATLVADVTAPATEVTGAAAAATTRGAPTTAPAAFATMPQAASSFGAVACDGWLYVYGGHVAPTHHYSTASVSGGFHRLSLSEPAAGWQGLPGGPPLQGLNVAAWRGKVYRVGGMSPRNKAGEPDDVRSVADCACFDPGTGRWTPLPPLPQPRSSHDVVVLGDQLIVTGGWDLNGDPDDAKWAETTLLLDLSAPGTQWRSVRQPFARRALTIAPHGGKLFVLGGFEADESPSLRVDVYDPRTDAWSEGPPLPGPDRNGFGPAACAAGDDLYVTVANGGLYRLARAGDAWVKVGATTPRIVGRLVPDGPRVLVVGGAIKQAQSALIEAVDAASVPAKVAAGG